MVDLKTKYIIKILPNGSQCLSASTGQLETLDKDSNVYEFAFEECATQCNDNNNHFIDDFYPYKKENFLELSNTPYLRHSPVSYENNLDKLVCMIQAH